jgi:hypothetical protein
MTLRPATVCAALLAALDASEGRSRSRKRDQAPDAIGLGIRRDLLERATHDDPPPEQFEQWLLDQADAHPVPGAALAIARAVLDDWHLAHRVDAFAAWLAQGAPSADAQVGRKAADA